MHAFTYLLVAEGLAEDAADEAEVVQVVRVDGRHGRRLFIGVKGSEWGSSCC